MVLISFVEALMRDAGIDVLVADQNMSVIEGSLGVLPRRILVPDRPARRGPRASSQSPASARNSRNRGRNDAETPPSAGVPGDHRRRLPRRPGRGRPAGRAAITAPDSRPCCSAPRSTADFAGTVVDLGAGAGVAGMVAAARCPAVRVVLVERDAERDRLRPRGAGTAGQCRLRRPRIGRRGRCRSARGGARSGRTRPRHRRCGAHQSTLPRAGDRRTASPGASRAAAHVLGAGGLDPWFRAAASRAEARRRVSSSSSAPTASPSCSPPLGGRFGALDILPVQPRAGEPAHRILVGARQGQPRAGPAVAAARPSRRRPAAPICRRSTRSCATAAGSAAAHPAWGARARIREVTT